MRQEQDPMNLARVYGRIGEKNLAFDWLEKALSQRDPYLVFLNVDGRFDPLHSPDDTGSRRRR